MIFFVTVLRAFAACLITNAHYEGIYPINLIANGGLIGDVLFFAISGYCLYHVKTAFTLKGLALWYGKRLWRVYPPVWVITAVYMFLGFYDIKDGGAAYWYVYPTYYHFIASIVILYIPFFFIMKVDILQRNIAVVIAFFAVAWLGVYCFAYDKSYYHIDNVREPMIRFLFIESMLLGAWFRQNDRRVRNSFKTAYPVLTVVVFLIYFVSKLMFSRIADMSRFQFLNQIVIFVLLYLIMRTFSGLDGKLERMPLGWKEAFTFLSKITLEIYTVQYVLIDIARSLGLPFPVNWIVLSASILISAYALHRVCEFIYIGTGWMVKIVSSGGGSL